jgi:4-hydroxythreonine-4-phosphate dehydrogenase
MTRAPLRLAVTLGDPRGIGPEVTAAARQTATATLVVVGPEGAGVTPDLAVGRWSGGSIEEAGRLAGAAIERAVALALAGEVDGIVTGPIDKSALARAGYPYPGHTEMLQALTGSPEVAMFMVAERTRLDGPLRVALATIHMALSQVPAAVSERLLVSQTVMVGDALRRSWGMEAPRLALCALNPHASDGGLFGDEEARIMAPAVEELRARGYDVSGPVPADTVFSRAIAGEFDAVIAPYHDVGMAAFKTVSFGAGVNVTLGLPFVRTSPDHGTALDIAGRGQADAGSMIEAVRLATRLASRLASGPRPATVE